MRVVDEPMTFARSWRVHLVAAVAFLVGMLTVALFVIGVVILTGSWARAHGAGATISPAGYVTLLLVWALAVLVCLIGFLMLAELARRAVTREQTTNQQNGSE